jgi:creatinine amidohydrolase
MPRTIYMPDMTNLEVREYLDSGGHTVIVPVGSTEDHGDHGPLWTDVYIPMEVANRAAPELDALVGPPVPFGLAADHRGASGLVYVRLETFVALLHDVCVTLAEAGFRRIVLLNGHYVGLKPEEAEAYLSGSAGIHANVGETSIVLAINPELCDMERVRDFVPELGELRTNPFALLDPIFLATPGSFWSLLEEGGGTWGKPSESTPEKGEEFLGWCSTAVVNLFRDMESVHDRIEPGYRRAAKRR